VSAERDAAAELSSLYQQKRFSELEAAARRLLAQYPDAGAVWKALGVACGALGKNDEALAAKQRAAELLPNDAEAHSNLANALVEARRSDDARRHFQKAIALDPAAISPLRGLAALMSREGRHKEAAQCHARLCVLQPQSAPALNEWGNSLRDAHEMESALGAYEKALALEPRMGEALCNIANTLADLGRPREAERRYREALEVLPARAEIHSNLANLLKNLGRHAEALDAHRETMWLDPAFAGGQSNYMLALNNVPGLSPQFIKSGAQAYGRWAASLVKERATPSPAHDGALRVGFVSGDFRRHPVGHFLESTLQHWPHDRVRLYAYSNSATSDALTMRLGKNFDQWRFVHTMSDEELAGQIVRDGIDVLVDLAGHTAFNRLTMFAWRPARVQATWLGYFATTGIAEIDWLISDETSVLPHEEHDYTERIWRLPGSRMCYTAPEETVDVAPPPLIRNGFATFGCFQNLGKLNDGVLALWARVLREVPRSRLRMQNVLLAEAEMKALFLERLAAAGIDAGRVELHGRMSRTDYLKAHAEVDVVLDTFPYPGGTTTCEALWMGVPTVTLTGTTLLSRQGESLLRAAGKPEWIARGKDDYAMKAVALAGDAEALGAARLSLRESVRNSALFDAPRFARELSNAFVSMARERTMHYNCDT